MKTSAILTKRESEIAELLAWGASKKDVANRLFVSERTVENHTRNIYDKIGCQKINELSAWWFCTKFHISFDLSPLAQKILTALMLLLTAPQVLNLDNTDICRTSTRTTRTVKTSRGRRSRNEEELEIITF